MADDKPQPEFMTTREVASLLRVQQRKVYDLAAAGDIPFRRVTGKLLFPRTEIDAWLGRGAPEVAGKPAMFPPPPNVLTGSHDPLLDWAVRESGSGLATFYDGSLDGLDRVYRREAIGCGLHVIEPSRRDWNIDHVSDLLHTGPYVLIEFAKRLQGLIVTPEKAGNIKGLADLRGRTVVHRQPSAGARLLFRHLLQQAELEDAVRVLPTIARTETEAAEIVASGKAEATLGIESAARQYRLPFVPLARERFDLAVDRHGYFEPPFQTLIAFCRGWSFSQKAEDMGGYDITGFGTVHWNA